MFHFPMVFIQQDELSPYVECLLMTCPFFRLFFLVEFNSLLFLYLGYPIFLFIFPDRIQLLFLVSEPAYAHLD